MKGTYRAYALSIKNLQLDFISVYFAKFYENKKKTMLCKMAGNLITWENLKTVWRILKC